LHQPFSAKYKYVCEIKGAITVAIKINPNSSSYLTSAGSEIQKNRVESLLKKMIPMTPMAMM
jgi:hypothetical protein